MNITYNYPIDSIVDPNVLFNSLGSFWISIFKETETIKGYTLGQAQEMVQNYLNLLEVINSYSIKDIPIFHRENWYPIIIKRSDLNKVPLKFLSDDNPEMFYFGSQPTTLKTGEPNPYAGFVFEFGKPKRGGVNWRSCLLSLPENFKNFSVITDRIISPVNVFVNGLDVILNNNVLIFKINPFEIDTIPRVQLIGNDGKPVKFIDAFNNELNDEMIVLWVYNASIDKNSLFVNFGNLFNLKLPSSQFYKDILTALVNIFIEGPTISSVRSVISSFLGVSTIIEATETVEEIFEDNKTLFVVTDKHVYQFNDYNHNDLVPEVKVGAILHSGDPIVSAVEYFDYIQAGEWWKSNFVPDLYKDEYNLPIIDIGYAFPIHLFDGSYKYQLCFKNEPTLVTLDEDGKVHFPIEGDPQDIATFDEQLNATPEKSSFIASKLGLSSENPAVVISSPLGFLFENFFKHNTALFKIRFKNFKQIQVFMSLMKSLKLILPKYILLLFYFEFDLPVSVYIARFVSDGSVDDVLPDLMESYKTADVTQTLFGLSNYLIISNQTPCLETVQCNVNIKDAVATNLAGVSSLKDIGGHIQLMSF